MEEKNELYVWVTYSQVKNNKKIMNVQTFRYKVIET